MFAWLGKLIYGAAVLALGGGLVCLLLGERRPTVPILRYLFSLVLVLMLLTPLAGVMDRLRVLWPEISAGALLPDTGEAAALVGRSTAALAEKTAADALLRILIRKTGIPPAALRIRITIRGETQETMEASSAEITILRADCRILRDKIRQYTEDTLECPCTVLFAGGGEE